MNIQRAMLNPLLNDLVTISEIFPRNNPNIKRYVIQYSDNKKFLGIIEYDRHDDFFLSVIDTGSKLVSKPHTCQTKALCYLVRTDLYMEMKEDNLL